MYIILALLIGLTTVVIGCWLSDNCWSPEPEGPIVTIAWPKPIPREFKRSVMFLGVRGIISPELPLHEFGMESPESNTPLMEVSTKDPLFI